MTGDSIRVREARDADGPVIGSLMTETFRDYPHCWYAPVTEMPQILRPGRFLRSHHGRWWVAVDESDVVLGTVAAHPVVERGVIGAVELKHLYVLKEARRRGIATRLESLALDYAAARQVRHLFLWTDTRFVEAHVFYSRLGWSDTGRTRVLNDLSITREHLFVKEIELGSSFSGNV